MPKCKDCGGETKYYDSVNRRILLEDRKIVYISVERYRCKTCKKIHRVSDKIVPYKHYAKEVIEKAKEDSVYIYPSDMTKWRWSQDFQLL